MSVQLRLIFAGEIQENVLILGDLHDRGDGSLGIFGWLRIRVVHLKDVARDTVGAVRSLLVHIHQHNVDFDHATHSLYMDTRTRNSSSPTGPTFEASGLPLTGQFSRPNGFRGVARRKKSSIHARNRASVSRKCSDVMQSLRPDLRKRRCCLKSRVLPRFREQIQLSHKGTISTLRLDRNAGRL